LYLPPADEEDVSVSIVTVIDVDFRYNDIPALKGVSFEVRRGEFLGVIGPNGSGKTTLIRVLDGVLAPERGTVSVNGHAIRAMRRRDIARLVAVVPQDFPMVFPFRVLEIVMMGRSPHLGMLRFEGEADRAIVRRAMEMTDTTSLADRGMDSLSGGERQRVLIARALAQEPEVILLDEPTAFLDIKHQAELFGLMKILNREQGLTVLAVTHDINLAAAYCDRVMLLREGCIHSLGVPGEVITEANIREVYETDVLIDANPFSGLPRVTLLGSDLRAERNPSSVPFERGR
ncbi:MAG: ABC transporter ATP-binding protein, partial [Deltaproteobacteria bacterium]|nr:ABC transporter ATP-binding protein [Deltaproteobacteria bacterium]